MILNTKRIHNSFRRNFPARAKQMQEKAFGHCAPKLKSLATVFELKIIIFMLNYLTVLVYTKTIIHLGVGG